MTRYSGRTYPELLIEYIKDAGQEIIDRADEMVNKNTDAIGDFWIDIRFDQEFGFIPEITWGITVQCKNTFDKYMRGEY